MLKLNAASTEQTWVDLLPGVRVQLKPPAVAMVLIARAAAVEAYIADNDAETKDPEIAVAAGLAMTRAYARNRIAGWEGIGDAEGEPAPVTHENVDLAMNHWAFHEAFDRIVFAPVMNEGRGMGA